MTNEKQKVYTINDFASQCVDFNNIAGALREVSWEDFKNQQSRLLEEVNEITEALNSKDIVETLDGVVDVMVVSLGMAAKLAMLGVDVGEAFRRVAENNLSKFPKDEQTAIDTVEFYKTEKQTETYYTKSDCADCYVIRRKSDNKIMKPKGYQSVDLSDLIKVEE